jgi:two-component system cell cycle sensor histidine kinase/response regulator CckA
MESVPTKVVTVPTVRQLLAGEAILALRETILIVEDEDFVRTVTSELIRESGYVVLSAANTTAARLLFMTSANPVALLVCDSVPPGENGLSLARALRRMSPQLKVLFVSGHPAPRMSRKANLRPAARSLQKPYSGSTLIAEIQLALKTKGPLADARRRQSRAR